VQFRVYYLDRRNRVSATVDIETLTLDDARREAGARRGEHPGLELWRVDEGAGWRQLVETLSPVGPSRH